MKLSCFAATVVLSWGCSVDCSRCDGGNQTLVVSETSIPKEALFNSSLQIRAIRKASCSGGFTAYERYSAATSSCSGSKSEDFFFPNQVCYEPNPAAAAGGSSNESVSANFSLLSFCDSTGSTVHASCEAKTNCSNCFQQLMFTTPSNLCLNGIKTQCSNLAEFCTIFELTPRPTTETPAPEPTQAPIEVVVDLVVKCNVSNDHLAAWLAQLTGVSTWTAGMNSNSSECINDTRTVVFIVKAKDATVVLDKINNATTAEKEAVGVVSMRAAAEDTGAKTGNDDEKRRNALIVIIVGSVLAVILLALATVFLQRKFGFNRGQDGSPLGNPLVPHSKGTHQKITALGDINDAKIRPEDEMREMLGDYEPHQAPQQVMDVEPEAAAGDGVYDDL